MTEKKRTQKEIAAFVVKLRAQQAAMNSMTKAQQIDVLEKAMASGKLPVQAIIKPH